MILNTLLLVYGLALLTVLVFRVHLHQHGALCTINRELESKNSELSVKNRELQKTLDEMKVLQGHLPMCANCKSIRDEKGTWNQIDSYMTEHADVEFSHGICPECAEQLYPGYKVDKPQVSNW